jgi:hypothetical protein
MLSPLKNYPCHGLAGARQRKTLKATQRPTSNHTQVTSIGHGNPSDGSEEGGSRSLSGILSTLRRDMDPNMALKSESHALTSLPLVVSLSDCQDAAAGVVLRCTAYGKP